MDRISDRTSPIGKISRDLMSGDYGDPETLDVYTVNAKGEKVLDPKKLFDLATTYQSSIGAREVGVVGSKEELLSQNINEVMSDFKTIDLIETKAKNEGISTEQAYREYRALVEIEQRKVLGLPLETKASGGQINDSINQFDSILRTIDG